MVGEGSTGEGIFYGDSFVGVMQSPDAWGDEHREDMFMDFSNPQNVGKLSVSGSRRERVLHIAKAVRRTSTRSPEAAAK